MIPKVIHYCWFGRGVMPNLALKCVESWKEKLPEYEFKLWNEENFDIHSNRYVEQAYKAKKFAFVSDYVRLYVLKEFGGIYLDTDVELIKSFNDLLYNKAFVSFETLDSVMTGVIGSEKQGEFISQLINEYDQLEFTLADGRLDLTTNVQRITNLLLTKGLVLNNQQQQIYNGLMVYPREFFSPLGRTGILNKTTDTYAIHHACGSWEPWRYKMKKFISRKILGPKITTWCVVLKRKLLNRPTSNL